MSSHLSILVLLSSLPAYLSDEQVWRRPICDDCGTAISKNSIFSVTLHVTTEVLMYDVLERARDLLCSRIPVYGGLACPGASEEYKMQRLASVNDRTSKRFLLMLMPRMQQRCEGATSSQMVCPSLEVSNASDLSEYCDGRCDTITNALTNTAMDIG